MIDTNTESFGMVLLIACMIGVVASIVGVRIYILSRKTEILINKIRKQL